MHLTSLRTGSGRAGFAAVVAAGMAALTFASAPPPRSPSSTPPAIAPHPAPTRLPPTATPAGPLAPHADGEVLIKFRAATSLAERVRVESDLGAVPRRRFRSGAERWRLAAGMTTEAALARLRSDPRVEYAEPNYLLSALRLPDDPKLADLHAFHNTGQRGGTPGADIDALRAWNVSTGDRRVIVAVIDTGLDATHPDLAANLYTNPGEIADNGVDDDGNGFVDDVHGWDFANEDNDPFDDNGHGTHVSGTIGAVGDNGVGVAGVNWKVSIMPLKFLGAAGFGLTSDAVEAIDYATVMGARVLSNSYGGGGFANAMVEAIGAGASSGSLFVAAAGNSGSNNDIDPEYPASYPLPNVVSVAATDADDHLATFSSWGANSVLLAAPGVDIVSTVPGGGYDSKRGTSMATPMVSGALALLEAAEPGLSVQEAITRLGESVDPLPALKGRVVTGGRLNLFRLLAHPDAVPPGAVTGLVVDEVGSTSVRLRFTATGDDGGTGRASTYDVRFAVGALDLGHLDDATAFPNRVLPGVSGEPDRVEVTGLLPSTAYAFAVRARDEWDSAGAPSAVASATTLGPPTLRVTPATFAAALRTGQVADLPCTIANVGAGTLDWSIAAIAAAPWLHAEPAGGRVGAGLSQPVVLRVDAAGLAGGAYDAAPILVSTDPDRAATSLPLALLVTDAPAIAAAPAVVDFGARFAGTTALRTLSIRNAGTIALTIGAIVADDASLALQEGGAPLALPWVVAPNATRTLVVAWSPSAPGALDAGLAMTSDASNAVAVRIRGVAVSPPRLAFDPAAIEVALDAGTATARTLAIENPGGSDLDVVLAAASNGGWLQVEPGSATIAAGGRVEVTVAIDAANRPAGPDTGAIAIDTNDPFRPHAELPVGLLVADAPHLAVTVPPEVLESRGAFDIAGAVTTHRLRSTHPAAGDGLVTGTLEGDFGNPVERGTFRFEGAVLGAAGGGGGDCVTATRVFPIPRPALDADLADGLLEASVTNAGSVDADCPVNRHTVRVTYPLPQDRIEFGAVLPGETRHRILLLANPGSRDLEVSRVSATGAGFAALASVRPAGSGTGVGDLRLVPGQVYRLDLTFGSAPGAGLAPGDLEGTLAIGSDDPHEPDRTLALHATLLPAPTVTLEPAGMETALLEGHQEMRAVTVVNHGDAPIDLALAVEGTPTATSAACPARAAYVAAYNLGTVTTFNPSGGPGTVIANGLFGPRALAVDPSGRRLYAIEFDGNFTTVDLATGALSRFRTGLDFMQGLALDPDGRTAWVTSFGDGALGRVDLATGVVTTVAHGLAGPHGVAPDRSGRAIYVAETGRGALVRVDPETGMASLVADHLESVLGLTLDAAGTTAYVTLEDRGVVEAIDLVTGAVRDIASGLVSPSEIARDPETGLLLVSEFGVGGVSLVDPATGSVVASLPGVPAPTGVAWRAPSICRGRFLTPVPAAVTVPAHGSVETSVRFDATGLAAGTWRADLVAGPADAFAPVARVPATLLVTARPRLRIAGKEVVLESQRSYNTTAARTVHTLPIEVTPGTDGAVDLTVEGDFGNGRETAALALDGTTIGVAGGAGPDCQPQAATFSVPHAALAAAAADGSIEITVQNTPDVAPTCTINRHRVRLRYRSADPAGGVDFGAALVGGFRSVPLTLWNDGEASLVIDAIEVPGAACAALPPAVTVAPFGGRDVTLRCAPSVVGPWGATLRVRGNDPDRPVAEVALRGTGTEPARLAFAPEHPALTLTEGAAGSLDLTLRNPGGLDLAVGASASGEGLVGATPASLTVPPGGEAPLSLAFAAAALPPGGHPSTLTLTTNDPARPRVDLPVLLTVLADRDRDGVADADDDCPDRPDPAQADADADGRGDACDVCPAVADPGQADVDRDGSGDACQPALLLRAVRRDAAGRLLAEARAIDPQGDLLAGRVRIEPLDGAPGFEQAFAGGLPRLLPLADLQPGKMHRLVLTVTDGTTRPVEAMRLFLYQGETALVVDLPPQAVIAPPPARVECDRPLAGGVRLDGGGSVDEDSTANAADIVRHAWFRRAAGGGPLQPLGEGTVLEAAVPFGAGTIVLRVTDAAGESSEAEVPVEVVDTTPPVIALQPSTLRLWPPDHTLRAVDLGATVADRCDPEARATIVAAISSEPDDAPGAGDGGTTGDVGTPAGAPCGQVRLRAERDARGPGRLYTLTCEARDHAGLASAATVTVVVPHDGSF
ncbi:MAG TPA: S8 family serine peptidase [Dongiaceae bacterium]|nr:S8 family serine peptidase [Dongiaceae bacterium]